MISRWVPYDIAKPLLDRNPYVVLSDASIIQNGESSPPQVTEDVMEMQLSDVSQEDANDALMDKDEEMIDPELASYGETDHGSISNILIGLEDSRLRYEV